MSDKLLDCGIVVYLSIALACSIILATAFITSIAWVTLQVLLYIT